MMAMILRRALLAALLLAPGLATAAEIRVMISGAFFEPFRQVAPQFERATGHRIVVIQGASMGNAPDAIPVRLEIRGAFNRALPSVGSERAFELFRRGVRRHRDNIADFLIRKYFRVRKYSSI